MSLSASWNATRALSRIAKFRRKAIPWAPLDQHFREQFRSHCLQGNNLELLPKTKVSGAYPLRMLNVFLARVHWISDCCKSVKVYMGNSLSSLVSMCCSI